MFYTKYRPQKFEQLFGLEPITKVLTSQLKKNQVGHAYLFHGPRGTGKTTTARLLAKEVGCQGLDLIEIDAASNRGIDDIRSLREKIGLAPAASPKKVYVIDEVHMLTREAFNALLKTLEEPPEHAILILCTTEPHKVPETIRSRCQQFEFRRASTRDIVSKMKSIVEDEGADIDAKDLELIAKNAEGGFRDAETMLEQMIVGGLAAEEVVGLATGESVGEFVELLLSKQVQEAIQFVNRTYESNSNLTNFNTTVLEYLRGLLLIKSGVGEKLLEAPEENYKQMKGQSSRLDPQKLDFMITEFTQAGRELQNSSIPQLPLEVAVVRIAGEVENRKQKREKRNEKEVGDPHKTSLEDKNYPKEQGEASGITEKWDSILGSVKSYNHSLEALLKSSRPLKFEDGSLTLEVFYKFHKEKLEQSKNRNILEKVVSEIFGAPTKIRCILGKRVKKSKDDQQSNDDKFDTIEKSAVEVFNGDL
jgi:DNA polymerase-3 subunit gamma/tau